MNRLHAPDVDAPLPRVGRELIDAIERAGIVGRGGAAFPAATKWRAVASRSRGQAVILVNGAEGEPQSKKDRVLMSMRPHLVLDGAYLAAHVLDARRVVLYIGERHEAARNAMLTALAARPEPDRRITTVVAAPARYVAGVETAAVHMVNEGVATPTTIPPYPFERGVEGLPTLVQNVETLAHIALLARTGRPPATNLVTVAGAVARPGVIEIEAGTTIAEAIGRGGGSVGPARAVLVGGYFGSWVEPEKAWTLPLDHAALKGTGLILGCGVVGVLGANRCPVCEVAAIMRYLAGESSAQCGPCFFGLRALAAACTRIASDGTNSEDIARLHRWAGEVTGRGACRHPDGAVLFLQSSLRVFGDEFAHHPAHSTRRSA
ncbi:MAG TPA: NADH-ubiquinone oxidoreductase-F iron-sulfur binding region domain-containing protein [Candidatus Dormibacteraeota bacterium]|nr:NADH-ubiquinone oxidoreductase-F iron-sulfur binding region domain-containing protein [Candidatus Dormibacteraeota bacterium]